ncbi:MAG: complex I NDUFA9 subunit family protein [Pseudomonadota bacterium]
MTHTKSCVILGGTGFVGRGLIHALRKRGYELVVPTRNREMARELLVIPELRLVTADIYDRDTLAGLVRDADVVINLVGILNERGHHRGRGFYVAHRDLTATLVEVCAAVGVPRLLQMSALKADAKKGTSDYLKSKGEAEDAIRAAGENAPAWTIFQPSVIFGHDDSFMNRFAQLLRIAPVMPLARANARFAPVFVDDVVAAFCAALDNDTTIGQTYQLCGPRVYSLREIVAYVRDLLGLRRPIIGLPDPIGRLQARIFDWLPGKPFSTDNFRSLMLHSICDQNGLLALGIEPTPLEAVAPAYLQPGGRADRLDDLRREANR